MQFYVGLPSTLGCDFIIVCGFMQLVFLHCDRYVEFHSQGGHYYKTRIPKFGRDFSYHYPSCDLYFVGARWENNQMLVILRGWNILLLERQINRNLFSLSAQKCSDWTWNRVASWTPFRQMLCKFSQMYF